MLLELEVVLTLCLPVLFLFPLVAAKYALSIALVGAVEFTFFDGEKGVRIGEATDNRAKGLCTTDFLRDNAPRILFCIATAALRVTSTASTPSVEGWSWVSVIGLLSPDTVPLLST